MILLNGMSKVVWSFLKGSITGVHIGTLLIPLHLQRTKLTLDCCSSVTMKQSNFGSPQPSNNPALLSQQVGITPYLLLIWRFLNFSSSSRCVSKILLRWCGKTGFEESQGGAYSSITTNCASKESIRELILIVWRQMKRISVSIRDST